MKAMKVLIVEDYEPIRHAVARAIKEQGGVVKAVANGAEGLWYALNHPIDIIVMDIMLPDMSGLEVLQKLRESGHNTPILILSANDSLEDKMHGLDLGADDYLTKPFYLGELLSRLKVLMRRSSGSSDPTIILGELEINLDSRQVTLAGESIDLSGREYALLEYLARRKGKITTRSEILDNVYGNYEMVASNVVDVYIGYLRKKLHKPGYRKYIHTKRGIGYLLEEGEWL